MILKKLLSRKLSSGLSTHQSRLLFVLLFITGAYTLSGCEKNNSPKELKLSDSMNSTNANNTHVNAKNALVAEVNLSASLSQIKDLQYTYAQYGQYGLWDEMTSLFSESAEIVIIRHGEKDKVIKSKNGINDYLRDFGNGEQGLPVGWLNNEMFMAPVVTLTGNGATATGRWQTLNMRGQKGGEAYWSGGFQINDYVKEDGVWKIAKVNIHEQFEGSYEDGWFAVGKQIPFVPYHYTSNEAGAPIPTSALNALNNKSNEGLKGEELQILAVQVDDLLAEDAVGKMQNIYGYYIDRKMWDDAADLFMENAVLEIASLGIYKGQKNIRKSFEKDGTLGLKKGQVHDLLQMHTVVKVAPNGVEASVRGMQWGFLTPELGKAFFSVSTFKNVYVFHEGIWRISEMHIYPKMKTDYYQGWHKSDIVEPIPTGELAPDHISHISHSPQVSAAIPKFFNNPVTGKPVTYPKGYKVVGVERDLSSISKAKENDTKTSIEAIRKKLDAVNAIDAIENISSTFAYYLDDYQWQRYAENYAPNGWRRKGWGHVYKTPAAIYRVESLGYGPSPTWDRDWIRPHTRIQPVIDLNEDGKSAYIRTRMILYFANSRSAGAFNSGMYPNDSAQLIDGVWKMNVGGWIDETYFRSKGYKLGWAKPHATSHVKSQGFGIRPPLDPNNKVAVARKALGRFPPDLDPAKGELGRRAYGVIRGQEGYASWPDIKPMWFHYKNPVSGRTPEFYCADAKVCVNESMDLFVEQLNNQ